MRASELVYTWQLNITPIKSVRELIRFAVLDASVWLIVSTSFVTRESTSPFVVESKNLSGRRLTFSSMSRRRRRDIYRTAKRTPYAGTRWGGWAGQQNLWTGSYRWLNFGKPCAENSHISGTILTFSFGRSSGTGSSESWSAHVYPFSWRNGSMGCSVQCQARNSEKASLSTNTEFSEKIDEITNADVEIVEFRNKLINKILSNSRIRLKVDSAQRRVFL